MGLDAISSPFYLRHILSSPWSSLGSSVFVFCFFKPVATGMEGSLPL